MGFSISGRVAAGAQSALEAELARALREFQVREDAKLANASLEQRKVEHAGLETERAANRTFRESQQNRADVGDILEDATPGPISSDTAGVLRKTPQGLARLSLRRIIEDARPTPGTMPLDTSGPQTIDVLEPTKQQAESQYRKTRVLDLTKMLSTAGNEQQRRSIGAQAFGEGIEVPSNLLGQTGAEKTAQELAGEGRQNTEWERRNTITSGQADTRQATSDRLMRERAGEARDEKPATSAQTTLASYASRLEQAEPTLSTLEKHVSTMNPVSFETQLWVDQPALQSPEMQQYVQASRNYVNAVLRRESGAVINPSEFKTARGQYLPQPGDTPETLEMKRQNRALNAATFKKGAGKAFQSVDDALSGSQGGTGSLYEQYLRRKKGGG